MPAEYFPWFSDSPELLQRLLRWLRDAENSTPETVWREKAMEAYRFYSGDQDTPEVKSILSDLNRPASTFNEIKPKVDMLIGLAAQTKHDITLDPVGSEDEAYSELLTGTYTHFRKKLKIARKELECFDHTVKSGRSYLYFHIDKSNPFEPKVCARRMPGYQVYVDPNSVEYDLSDARYVFVDKWLTEEEISRFWPDYNITNAQTGSRYYDMPTFWNEAKDLYRIVECWYKVYDKVTWFQNPVTGAVENLPPEKFKELQKAFRNGMQLQGGQRIQTELSGVESFVVKYKYAILSNSELIEEGYSPFKMDMYPIAQFGAYKDEDNNRWFGVIEMMEDPQKALNTMRRQLSHLLQTLPKGILVHEVGAILNIEEYEERSSEPNFHMEVAVGKMQGYKFETQPGISPLYQALDVSYSQSMKDTSGIQNEMMGVQTTSREPGVSVRARQETNMAVLYLLFDNFRESRHNAAKIATSLITQYVTAPQIIRIQGEQGKQLIQINTQMNPQMPGFNDITSLDYDVAMEDSTETATTRLSIAQVLTEYSQNNPGSVPPDIIMEYAGVPFTVKNRIKQSFEAQQQAAQQAADREYELKKEELEIKRLVAQAQISQSLTKHKEVMQKDKHHSEDLEVKKKEVSAKKQQAARPKLRAVK